MGTDNGMQPLSPGDRGPAVADVHAALKESGTKEGDHLAGLLDRYVDGPLKAAWEVVHGDHDKKVLGAAFTPYQQAADGRSAGSFNLGVTKAYVDAGYLDRVDYAGFHPDLTTPGQQEAWVSKARTLLAGKPLWVSEWQLNRSAYQSDGEYLDAMSRTVVSLRSRSGLACYLGFTDQEGSVPVTRSGFGGYQEDDPAFSTYRDWPKK